MLSYMKKARLDADKTAKPLTKIIGARPSDGKCRRAGSETPVALENENGERTPVGCPKCTTMILCDECADAFVKDLDESLSKD